MRVCEIVAKFNEDRQIVLSAGKVYSGYQGCCFNAESVVDFFCRSVGMDKEIDEYGYIMCFDAKLKPVAMFEVAHGGVNSAAFGARDVYSKALMVNATGVVMLHNHPSGEPEPSPEDDAMTKRLEKAGRIVGVQLLDHIIIGDRGKWYSYVVNRRL